MTTAIKRRRGTTVQHSTFTGLEGEITVDTTKDTLVVHDGATAGGFPLATEAAVNSKVSLTGDETVAGTKTLSSNPILSAGTANGVPYLNGSKVLTTGSALTFDGSKLTVKGGNAGQFVLDNSNEQYIQQLFQRNATANTGSDFLLDGSGNTFNFRNLAANMPFVWHLSASAGAPTEQMRLTSTGLGIGTSSPGAKLDVANGTFQAVRTFLPSITDTYHQYRGTPDGVGYEHARVYSGRDAAQWTYGSYLAFYTEGKNSGATDTSVERMRIDPNGNLGLGVTPSAWGSGWKASQIGDFGGAVSYSGGAVQFGLNTYHNGTNWLYTASATASLYQQVSGTHKWYNAPSGTAGNAISFTQAMTLFANGNLSIGTSSDNGGVAVDNRYIFARANNAKQFLRVGTDGSNDIFLAGAELLNITGSSGIKFNTGTGSERARIDSSGNFIHQVNGTAPTLATNSTMSFQLTSNTSLKIVVRGTDGVTRSVSLTLA